MAAVYTSITSDDEKFELSATFVDGKYKYPGIDVCPPSLGWKDKSQWQVWDNDTWIKKELIPYVNGDLLKKHMEYPVDLSAEDILSLKEILDLGMLHGFFSK